MGLTYGKLGDHQKALEYERKALAIRKKVLPPEHPNLASSYNNVGMTYGQLGRHRKELVYELKALEIQEKVLPPEHPDLAISCKNIAGTLHRMRDIPDAAKFMRRTADIISRSSLPEDRPYRVNYPTLAELYELEIARQRKYRARLKKQRPEQPPFGK